MLIILYIALLSFAYFQILIFIIIVHLKWIVKKEFKFWEKKRI